jgi:uncharacterized protein
MGIQKQRFRLLLIYGVVLSPLVIWQAMQAVETTANSPLDWSPANSPARVEYSNFERTFGSGDVVVLSWEGCTIAQQQLDSFVAVLREAPAFFDAKHSLFDQVTSGRELVQQLVSVGIAEAEAIDRLRGTMIGSDGSTTFVVIGFTKQGLAQRARLVPLIQQAAERYCGVPGDEQHLAGPVIDGLSVDLASAATLQKLAVPSSAAVFFVGLWCLGSWRATVIVFGISLYCQAVTLALISLCGDTMSALLIVLPPLIQVLALAAGIHLVNYYRSTDSDGSRSDAAGQAFKIGWLPCVLSAGTTAVGMASLLVSDLAPIRSFGAYATAGLLLTTGLVLLLVPTTLAAWRVPVIRDLRQDSRDKRTMVGRPNWEQLANGLAKHHALVTIGFLFLMVVLGWSMSRLKASVRIETLFAKESRILADYRWLESRVAPLVPIEIVVAFDASSRLSQRERLSEVQRIEAELRTSPQVLGSMSALTFLPSLPTEAPRNATEARAMQQLTSRTEAAAELAWTRMRLLSQTNGKQKWRIRGFVSALEQTDYGELLFGIRRRLTAIAVKKQGADSRDFTIRATGIMPLVHDVQRQLMSDLRSSFLLAFLLITVVMTVVQGSVSRGVVAMLPNLFPTLLMFGILGWIQLPLDIGSVMTASIALGVAVDDTLHFLTYFQRCTLTGATRKHAVVQAYRHCGRAMLQSSLICGAGLAVFAWSDFVPTARFAWMMVALFGAAILGDLVLLPALLLGPIGKLWEMDHESKAASIVNPGPNASATQSPSSRIVPRLSRTNATVGDDMLP